MPRREPRHQSQNAPGVGGGRVPAFAAASARRRSSQGYDGAEAGGPRRKCKKVGIRKFKGSDGSACGHAERREPRHHR